MCRKPFAILVNDLSDEQQHRGNRGGEPREPLEQSAAESNGELRPPDGPPRPQVSSGSARPQVRYLTAFRGEFRPALRNRSARGRVAIRCGYVTRLRIAVSPQSELPCSRSAALNTSISAGSTDTVSAALAAAAPEPVALVSTKYPVQFPGRQREFHRRIRPRVASGSIRSAPRRSHRRTHSLSLHSRICSCAISTPGGARSSRCLRRDLRGLRRRADSKMLSARVSNSNELSLDRKGARIFRQTRQGVEDFAAFSAAHLAARGAQHFRG